MIGHSLNPFMAEILSTGMIFAVRYLCCMVFLLASFSFPVEVIEWQLLSILCMSLRLGPPMDHGWLS